MPVRDAFEKLLRSQASVIQPRFIPSQNEVGCSPEPDDAYVEIRLAQMFLKHSRELYTTFYPSLVALARLAGIGGTRETSGLIRPTIPGDPDPAHLDRVLTLNQSILNPTPYRGGSVDLLIGLCSTPANDWSQRFLEFAHEVSTVAMQAPLAAGVSLAAPLKGAIDRIFGTNELQLRLGLNVALEPDGWLKDGHLAIINAPADDSGVADIAIQNGTLCTAVKPYDSHDFILLNIRVRKHHDAWQEGELGVSWRHLIDAITASDLEDVAGKSYQRFAAAVCSSAELTWPDKTRICKIARSRIEEVRANVSGHRGRRAVDSIATVKPSEMARTPPEHGWDIADALGTEWLSA